MEIKKTNREIILNAVSEGAFCPLSGTNCNFKNCIMIVIERENKKTHKYCSFADYFIEKCRRTHIVINEEDLPLLDRKIGQSTLDLEKNSKILLKRPIENMEEEINNFFSKEEIIKELKPPTPNRYNVTVRLMQMYYNNNSIENNPPPGYYTGSANLSIEAEKKLKELCETCMEKYIYEKIKKQKEKLPLYLKEFVEWADEHEVTVYKKELFDSFLTIKNIKLYAELNPPLKTLVKAEVSRRKKDKIKVRQYIYFAKSEMTGKVKIGISKHPDFRVKQIQTACPDDLEIIKIIPGDLNKERGIHQTFEDLKQNGEWFTLTDELLAFINNL